MFVHFVHKSRRLKKERGFLHKCISKTDSKFNTRRVMCGQEINKNGLLDIRIELVEFLFIAVKFTNYLQNTQSAAAK